MVAGSAERCCETQPSSDLACHVYNSCGNLIRHSGASDGWKWRHWSPGERWMESQPGFISAEMVALEIPGEGMASCLSRQTDAFNRSGLATRLEAPAWPACAKGIVPSWLEMRTSRELRRDEFVYRVDNYCTFRTWLFSHRTRLIALDEGVDILVRVEKSLSSISVDGFSSHDRGMNIFCPFTDSCQPRILPTRACRVCTSIGAVLGPWRAPSSFCRFVRDTAEG